MSKIKSTILIVEDDEDVLYTTRLVLSKKFSTVLGETDPKRLHRIISQEPVEIIILDMNFSKGRTNGNEGLFWLREILKIKPSVAVIMHTAYADINLAVEAMKIGAVDFLVKPWEPEKIVEIVHSALQNRMKNSADILFENKKSIKNQSISSSPTVIIGVSNALKQVLALISKVAPTDANVLILGENGTGKELVAQAIHEQSQRKSQPLVRVDVGAIAESLLESEMFGHKKGAFTNAKEDRVGKFVASNRGTLFLDEISNISLASQAKLLSALQTRKIVPVGSNESVSFDTRLITASNISLHDYSREGSFRQDLLYRINTVEIVLPPLRNRKEDIPQLAQYFLQKYAAKYNRAVASISNIALEKLQGYNWPGNIRELQHSIERAVILANATTLQPVDFDLSGTEYYFHEAKVLTKDELEKRMIKQALSDEDNNLTEIAKKLGIGRTTLYRKIKKYGL
jgi:two-component system response regulator HydG